MKGAAESSGFFFFVFFLDQPTPSKAMEFEAHDTSREAAGLRSVMLFAPAPSSDPTREFELTHVFGR